MPPNGRWRITALEAREIDQCFTKCFSESQWKPCASVLWNSQAMARTEP